MPPISKYPRTPHLQGSKLQPGDEDLEQVPLRHLVGRSVVVEEKVDGANCAVSFTPDQELLLQSRGHYVEGGPREEQFGLLKTWASCFATRFWELLADRYIMYGEWLYAKHTVYYDHLPHYFMEFDIYDRVEDVFLSTPRRHEMLAGGLFGRPAGQYGNRAHRASRRRDRRGPRARSRAPPQAPKLCLERHQHQRPDATKAARAVLGIRSPGHHRLPGSASRPSDDTKSQRDAVVPAAVMERLIHKWEVPRLTKAHQVEYR